MKIIILLLFAINIASFTISCVKHNQPQTGTYNWRHSLIALIFIWVLYYYAGLFTILLN